MQRAVAFRGAGFVLFVRECEEDGDVWREPRALFLTPPDHSAMLLLPPGAHGGSAGQSRQDREVATVACPALPCTFPAVFSCSGIG